MDPQDEMRQAIRDLFDELGRVAEQAGKMLRQVADDAARWGGPTEASGPPDAGDVTPFAAIRELGRLRDEGLITDAEFEAKKTEILEHIR
jgi:hypothetical protein